MRECIITRNPGLMQDGLLEPIRNTESLRASDITRHCEIFKLILDERRIDNSSPEHLRLRCRGATTRARI